MHTCTIPALVQARAIANDYIEQCITRIYETADNVMKKAYVSNKISKTREHLYQNLRRAELEPHITATEGTNIKRCTMTTRQKHTTIMRNEERIQLKDCQADATKIQESIQRWPHSVKCDIFKPETLPYTHFDK